MPKMKSHLSRTVDQVIQDSRPGARLARKILAAHDEENLWSILLGSPDERIRLDALKYLSDRAYGRAPQAFEVGGTEGGLPVQMVWAGSKPPWISGQADRRVQ